MTGSTPTPQQKSTVTARRSSLSFISLPSFLNITLHIFKQALHFSLEPLFLFGRPLAVLLCRPHFAQVCSQRVRSAFCGTLRAAIFIACVGNSCAKRLQESLRTRLSKMCIEIRSLRRSMYITRWAMFCKWASWRGGVSCGAWALEGVLVTVGSEQGLDIKQ
jgi:hypothetical protein